MSYEAKFDRQAHGVIHGDLRTLGEKGAEMTTWTKPKPMLKHERELWRDEVLDAAEGGEAVARIAKALGVEL